MRAAILNCGHETAHRQPAFLFLFLRAKFAQTVLAHVFFHILGCEELLLRAGPAAYLHAHVVGVVFTVMVVLVIDGLVPDKALALFFRASEGDRPVSVLLRSTHKDTDGCISMAKGEGGMSDLYPRKYSKCVDSHCRTEHIVGGASSTTETS